MTSSKSATAPGRSFRCCLAMALSTHRSAYQSWDRGKWQQNLGKMRKFDETQPNDVRKCQKNIRSSGYCLITHLESLSAIPGSPCVVACFQPVVPFSFLTAFNRLLSHVCKVAIPGLILAPHRLEASECQVPLSLPMKSPHQFFQGLWF